MIRDGDWKYTYWVDDMPELYDLSSDPQELNNLALLPSHAAKVKDLKQKLFEWHTPPVWQGSPSSS
jgi:choline-sulfatase